MQAERLELIYKTLRKHDELIDEILYKLNMLIAQREENLNNIKDRKLRLLRLIYNEKENACILTLIRKIGADRKTIMRDLLQLRKLGLALYAPYEKRNNPGKLGNKPHLTSRGRLIAQQAYQLKNIPK